MGFLGSALAFGAGSSSDSDSSSEELTFFGVSGSLSSLLFELSTFWRLAAGFFRMLLTARFFLASSLSLSEDSLRCGFCSLVWDPLDSA
jgi:hypothetical protein